MNTIGDITIDRIPLVKPLDIHIDLCKHSEFISL